MPIKSAPLQKWRNIYEAAYLALQADPNIIRPYSAAYSPEHRAEVMANVQRRDHSNFHLYRRSGNGKDVAYFHCSGHNLHLFQGCNSPTSTLLLRVLFIGFVLLSERKTFLALVRFYPTVTWLLNPYPYHICICTYPYSHVSHVF